MPVSWKGTLQQYVGRLHRLYDAKRVVRVYDYVDSNIQMLARMYVRRLKGYSAIGYRICNTPYDVFGRERQATIPLHLFDQEKIGSPVRGAHADRSVPKRAASRRPESGTGFQQIK